MNPLVDLLPVRYRRYLYALVSLAVLVYGAWQASEGNVEVFIGSLVTSLASALALANASDPAGQDEDPTLFD